MPVKKICIAILLVLFASSCGNIVENKFPGIDISIVDMNNAFVVEDPPIMVNSHKNNEPLFLTLVNKSNSRIVFPDDYGMKIFKKAGQNWIPVENNLGYSAGQKILTTLKESPLGLSPAAIPIILDLKQEEIIRIVFVGHEDTPEGKVVGAYIELTLLP